MPQSRTIAVISIGKSTGSARDGTVSGGEVGADENAEALSIHLHPPGRSSNAPESSSKDERRPDVLPPQSLVLSEEERKSGKLDRDTLFMAAQLLTFRGYVILKHALDADFITSIAQEMQVESTMSAAEKRSPSTYRRPSASARSTVRICF